MAVWRVGYQGLMASEARRDDRALRAVWHELRRPRVLVTYLRKSGDLTVPLIFAGPTFVLVSYVVAFGVTPADGAGAEFHSAAAQIIPVLLLVLAIEGQLFRWNTAQLSLSTGTREDIVGDDRFRRFAAREGPLGEVIALIPLLTGDPGETSAKPVMAAIVAGFAGVAYVAITGSRWLSQR